MLPLHSFHMPTELDFVFSSRHVQACYGMMSVLDLPKILPYHSIHCTKATCLLCSFRYKCCQGFEHRCYHLSCKSHGNQSLSFVVFTAIKIVINSNAESDALVCRDTQKNPANCFAITDVYICEIYLCKQ